MTGYVMQNSSNFVKSHRRSLTRRGSTLVVVVALLGMLVFLGFVFYTFAKQERANAQTFSNAAKDEKGLGVDPDSVFDFALEQVILGPDDSYFQSILWGGRHSLLANMFGRDGIPWNGEGVSLLQDSTGTPYVDMNLDGLYTGSNDNQSLLYFVDSPAANASAWTYGSSNVSWGADPTNSFSKVFRGSGSSVNQTTNIPEPDVNYNAPDLNSVFLSYDGITLDATATNPTRVIIPSFLRPQLLRSGGTVISNWYQNAAPNQIMRPHSGHLCVGADASGNPVVNASFPKRFVSSAEIDTTVTPNRPMYQSLNLRRPFTFGGFAPEDAGGTPTTGQLGNWDGGSNLGTINGVAQYQYDLDVDTDGDGILDAILMDLGYPPIRRGDGKLVVPLVAISIRDLNGLLNVNATGNLSGNINLAELSHNVAATPPYVNQNNLGSRRTGGTFGGSTWTGATYVPDNLSKSNLGLSTYEINIQRALTADPTYTSSTSANDPILVNSAAGAQLSYFLQQFDPSIQTSTLPSPGRSIAELANLEWLALNIGRAGFQLGIASSANPVRTAITTLFGGRSGELPRLRTFLSTFAITDMPVAGLSTTWSGGAPTNWLLPPAVNSPNPDDNNNVNEGERNQGEAIVTNGQTAFNTRWFHPLDFRGSGQAFQRNTLGADGLPGHALIDDDNNGVVDDFSEEGWTTSDDAAGTNVYGKVPEFARFTPSPSGTTATSNPNYWVQPPPAQSTPLAWPAYWGYQSFYGVANGGIRWGETQTTRAYHPWLMQFSQSDSLLDEPAEAIIDPTLRSTAYASFLNYLSSQTPTTTPANSLFPLNSATLDAVTNAISNDTVFGAHETLFLQGTGADAATSGTRSRLADLMPGNLVASQAAPTIRKRLTTVSQDRREFGIGMPLIGGARSWESSPVFPPYGSAATTYANSAVADGNPYRSELFHYLLQEFSNTGSTSLKINVNRWLYLDQVTGGNQYGFAPLPEQTSPTDINAAHARQCMARDIYTLLYTFCCVHFDGSIVDADYRTVAHTHIPTAAQSKEMAQFAVNLVDALDTDDIITAFYYDTDLSNAGHGWQTTSTSSPDYMYGFDGIPGNNDDNVVYGVERQMLTFSEATAFVVKPVTGTTDSNLTIFDDTLTSSVPGGMRQYLFFELQNVSPTYVKLASPSITIANAPTAADWRIRMVDPTNENTTYNTLYFLPGLNTTSNYLPANPDGSATPVVAPGGLFSVACQDGSDTIGGAKRSSDFRADPSMNGTSYPLAVPTTAHTADGLPDSVTITSSTGAAQFTPKCNLDLVWNYPDGASRFLVVQGNTGIPGGFVSQLAQNYTNGSAAGGVPLIRLVLERRAAAGPDVANNFVWASVDKTSNPQVSAAFNDVIIGSIVPPDNTAGAAGATTALQGFNSFARTSPLLRGTATQLAGISNTINAASTTANPNVNATAWQLHGDRDFGSLSELLNIPLCGPGDLTSALANVVTPNVGLASPSLFYQTKEYGTSTYLPSIAAARFLRPDNPDYAANGNTTTNYGNRWYRLFNFLEVPNRGHQHPAIVGIPPSGTIGFGAAGNPNYGLPVTFTNAGTPGSTSLYQPTSTMFDGSFNLPQYFGWPRTHGLLNLNMIRDPQVLLALLDDDQQINDPRYGTAVTKYLDSQDPSDTDSIAGGFRKWWFEFLKSRDSRYIAPASGTPFAVDPVTHLYAPGTANGRPFQSLDTIGPVAHNLITTTTDSPLENTVLRSLPLDSSGVANANESRRLFEIGNNTTDHFGVITTEANPTGAPPIHPSARYRLLSKLMNNTTTRSNSFAIYMTVQYYEAAQVTVSGTNLVRIGGKLDDTPVHRGFFIVDRTGAVDQMKTLSTNVANSSITVTNPATFPVSNSSYSFQTNTDTTGQRQNMNGIRWRDLVLYRQILD